MLLCGKDSSTTSHNWKGYRHQYCLYGELPIQKNHSYHHGHSSITSYCTFQYDYVLFVCTRIFRQTLSMLRQRHYQGNHQSLCVSLQVVTGIILR